MSEKENELQRLLISSFENNNINSETVKDLSRYENEDWSTLNLEELPNFLLNDGDAGNPYYQVYSAGKKNRKRFREAPKTNIEEYAATRESVKDFDSDSYYDILDGFYNTYAKRQQELGDNATDEKQKQIHYRNKELLLDKQSEFKRDVTLDKLFLGLTSEFLELPHDLLIAAGKGKFNALSFIYGDVPIYGGRLSNHLYNTLGVDVLGNIFTSDRIKTERQSTPDVENMYGETYDPNITSEKVGAFLRGYQNKSGFSPQGAREAVEFGQSTYMPYLSESFGVPIVRDVAETVADLGGLSQTLINRFTKKGLKVQAKGDDYISKIASLSEKSFRKTLLQDGIGTAMRYKTILPRAEGYNYAYKAVQNTQEGASIMRRYKMGQVGFGTVIGTDHLIANDFLSKTTIKTSQLPIFGKEGEIPLFTLDTPWIIPVTYISAFGMNTFGNAIVNKAQVGSAHIQLAMKAFPLSPDPRFLTPFSKFGQKKTTRDVISNYILNVKRVAPEVVEQALKNIDDYGKTLIVDRRGGKSNQYTVYDKLLEMWLQNVKGTSTANPMKQDGQLTVAYKSFNELMGYMNMSRQEINSIGQLVKQVHSLPEKQRNEVLTRIEATEKLQEDIMGYFMTADENGVLQIKEQFTDPNRLGPNQKPLTVDDVLNFRMFVDDYITQGQVSEVRNAIAKSADMGMLGSDLTSVLSNERLEILKQEENNLATLTKMHNMLLTTMPTDNADINAFMENAGIVLQGYKDNNIRQQSDLVIKIDELKSLAEMEMTGTPYPDLVMKVQQALGENISGEVAGSVTRFDNVYTKIVGKENKGIQGRINIGKTARDGYNADVEKIFGRKRKGQTVILGIIDKAYEPVKNRTIESAFPDLSQQELVDLNGLIQGAKANPRVRRAPDIIQNIAPEGSAPIYQLNPNAKIDTVLAARSFYLRQQTLFLRSGPAGLESAASFGDRAGGLTEYLEEVPGFEKANQVYRDYATPINNAIGDVFRELTPAGESKVPDYQLVSTFVDYALKDPETAAQYITGKHENDVGDIVPNGFRIFGPKSKQIITEGIAHQIEDGQLSAAEFDLLSRNFFPLIFSQGEPKLGILTGKEELTFTGGAKDLKDLISARDALPGEVKSIITQYTGDLEIQAAKYADNITNLDKILEGTVAGVGPKNELKFLDQLQTNKEGMIQLRQDFLDRAPEMTETQYNNAVMTLVSESIYEQLAGVSVKGIKPSVDFLDKPKIEISPTENILPLRPTVSRDQSLRQQMDENRVTFDEILIGQVDAYSAIVKKFKPIIEVHGSKEQVQNLNMTEQVRTMMSVTTDNRGGRVLNIPEPLPLKTLLSLTGSYMRQVIGGRWFLTMLGINAYRNKNARFLTNVLMNPASRDTIAKLTSGQDLTAEEIKLSQNLLFAIYPSATQLGYAGDEAAKKDEELQSDFNIWFNENILNKFK